MSLTHDHFIESYWYQYIAIEREFGQTIPYVAIDNNNETTFSANYLKLLLQIGSEVDIVAKIYSGLLDGSFSGSRINEYSQCITQNEPQFDSQQVKLINSNKIIQPWNGWSSTNSPDWWKVYNKVKHERDNTGTIGGVQKEYAKFASQKYTIEALAGLYQLEMCICLKLSQNEARPLLTPLPGSRILTMQNGFWQAILISNADFDVYSSNGAMSFAIAPFKY